MKTSLELLSIPDIIRKIRIWVYSTEPSLINVNWAGNQQTFSIDVQVEHTPIIISHGDESNNTLTVECLSGQVNIGIIDINYSWTINSYFTNKYPDQVERLLKSNCDLTLIDSDFRKDLSNRDLFLSTGENDFAAITHLVSNVYVNEKYQDFAPWYSLNTGDIYSSDIYVTTPSIEPVPEVSVPDQSSSTPELKYEYDADFISNLDTRFYEFVNKKLADRNIKWNDQIFTGYQIPYGYAIRIQNQLVDNIELIKDKHVFDLGTDRGSFLYPCIELGCKSVTGAQPLPDYNNAINEALIGLNLNDKASAVWGDAYDLPGLTELLKGKDTLLMLGLMYHLNNHYQLLEAVTKTNITGLVIEMSINFWYDHYMHPESAIKWKLEQQNVDVKGWEFNGINKDWTWVGYPNAAWFVQTLKFMGWKIKSNIIHSILRTSSPQLIHRGVVTAYR
jgi:hypothetical protein